jgi:hypothetical protein
VYEEAIMTENLDTQAAMKALKAYRASLPDPQPPLIRPPWADAESRPVAVYTVRGRLCYVFALEPPLDGIDGFVLDTVALVPYEVWRGNLAVALSLVGVA